MRKLLYVFVAASLLLSCSKQADTINSASSIVIPEGGLIQFNPVEFSSYANREYAAYFREIDNDNNLKTILEITPSKQDRIDGNRVFSTVVPKGTIIDGLYVVDIVMDSYPDNKLTAFVFNGEVAKPSINTTLLWNALKSYSGKSIKLYSVEQIKSLQTWIDDYVSNKMLTYGLDKNTNFKKLYKFLQNGLANNPDFIAKLKEVGANFNYAYTTNQYGTYYKWQSGDILFSKENHPPQLSSFSTKPGIVVAWENVETLLQAYATDDDGDLIFYVWRKKMPDGSYQIVDKDVNMLQWIPGYEDAGEYFYQVLLSDGGLELSIDWDIIVNNTNRSPHITIGNCPSTINERETWSCTLTSQDMDGNDDMYWTVVPSANISGEFRLNNNVITDFVNDLKNVKTKDITLTWVPNNLDAQGSPLDRFSVTLVDGPKSGGNPGADSTNFTLKLNDLNSNPEYIFVDRSSVAIPNILNVNVSGINVTIGAGNQISTPIQETVTNFGVLRKWDSVCDVDPDTQLNTTIYKFNVEVKDPDDLTLLPGDTPDKVTITFSTPSLSKNHGLSVVNPNGTYDAVNKKTVFEFQIKPTISAPAGMLYEIDISDDHGSPQIPYYFSYKIENRLSCAKLASDTSSTVQLNESDTTNKIVKYSTQGAYGNTATNSYNTDIVVNFGSTLSNLNFLPYISKNTVSNMFLPFREDLSSDFIDKVYYTNDTQPTNLFVNATPFSGVFGNGFYSQNAASYVVLTQASKNSFSIPGDNRISVTYSVNLNGVTVPGIIQYFRIPLIVSNIFSGLQCPMGVAAATVNDLQFSLSQLSGVQAAFPMINCYYDFISNSQVLGPDGRKIYPSPTDSNNYTNVTFTQINSPSVSNIKNGYFSSGGGRSTVNIQVNNAGGITKIPKGAYFILKSTDAFAFFYNYLGMPSPFKPEYYIFETTRDFYNPTDGSPFIITAMYSYNKMHFPSNAVAAWDYLPAGSTAYNMQLIDSSGYMGANLFSLDTNDSSVPFSYSVSAILRPKVSIGALSKLISDDAVNYPNISNVSVSNSAGIDYDFGNIQVSNNSSSPVVISADHYHFESDLGVKFYTPADISLAANEQNKVVTVYRFTKTVSAGSINRVVKKTNAYADLTGLTISNPKSIIYKDGAVSVTNNSGSTVNLQKLGYILVSTEGLKFNLSSDYTINNGQTTTVNVSRDTGSFIADSITTNFSANEKDSTSLTVLTAADNISVSAGSALDGHEIYITDGNAKEDIRDQNESYKISLVNDTQTFLPSNGVWQLCRHKKSQVATCYPCTNFTDATAGIEKDASRFCYLRYDGTVANGMNDIQTDNKKYTFKLQGQGNRTNPATLPTKIISMQIVETNTTPNFAKVDPGTGLWSTITAGDYIANPVTGGTSTLLNSQTLQAGFTFQEGSTSTFKVYAMDSDKTTVNSELGFAISELWYPDASGVWQKETTLPTGLSVLNTKCENEGTVSSCVDANFGSKNSADISWMPTDAQAKKYSKSPEGIILKVKTYTKAFAGNATLETPKYTYYKFIVNNINNPPSLKTIVNNGAYSTYDSNTKQFTIYADTYFAATFTLEDKDGAIALGGSYQTSLTMCPSNAEGNYTCGLDASWSTKLQSYDASYTLNSGSADCRNGDGSLKAELAVPRLTRTAGPTNIVTGEVQYTYKLEWCPQRQHIGEFSGNLTIADYGDKDRQGASGSALSALAGIKLKIVSRPFFVSPKLNMSLQPVHYPRQVSANMSANPFSYPVIVNNSLNYALTYSILQAPTGLSIDPSTGIINWLPGTSDIGTNPSIKIKVTDSVGNSDSVNFNLLVQNPNASGNVEKAPTISSFSPNVTDVSVIEDTPMTFDIVASDANPDDYLFYRWYVDGKIIEDKDVANAESTQFIYTPDRAAGGTDVDGSTGPLKIGEHIVRGEVSDGNYTVYKEWKVKVKNVYLDSSKIFDLTSARKESAPAPDTGKPSSLLTAQEVLAPFVYVDGGGNSINYDHLVLANTYSVIGPSLKRNIWDLLFVAGDLKTNIYGPKWSFNENANWSNDAKRLSYKVDAYGVKVYLSPLAERYANYTDITNSLTFSLNSDLSSQSLTACTTSTCTSNFFLSEGSGDVISKYFKVGTTDVVAYYDPNERKLKYDKGSSGTVVQLIDMTTGNANVYGMAYSSTDERLYIVISDSTTGSPSTYFKIYNMSPVKSGGTASLLSTVLIGNGDYKPKDLVIAPQVVGYKVFTLMNVYNTGGGLAYYDSTDASIHIVSNGINSSPLAGKGTRLVYNSADNLIYGLLKDSNQIVTYDPVTAAIYTSATMTKCDSILISPSGLILLVDRASGIVYKGK